MRTEIADLQKKVCYLESQNSALESSNNALSAEVDNLRAQLARMKKMLFGPRSEKLRRLVDPNQISLFDEAEAEAAASAETAEEEETREVKGYKRKARKRIDPKELEDKLPVEEREEDIPEAERSCPECNGPLERIGREFVRYELEHIPSSLKLIKVYKVNYKCKNDCNAERPVFAKATVPPSVLPHSLASPSTVAGVMVQKYLYAVPLYRQERQWEEMGVPIPRNTLANWVIRAAEEWLSPLVGRMRRILLQERVVHSDETPLQVLLEPEGRRKHKSKKCYMWVLTVGEYQKERLIVIYNFYEGRKQAYARDMLGDFHGCLQTDGYASYDGLEVELHVLCWAHVRRKFADVLPAADRDRPEKSKTVAGQALVKIAEIFAIDAKLADLTPEERKELRLQQEKPLLQALKSWLETRNVVPRSKIAEAIGYTLNHWTELTAYLEDGLCAMTNNICERAIRPFTVGRKNWLFSASANGAEASANVYSIVGTCKLNEISPYRYLNLVFTELPRLDLSHHPELLDKYLPWSEYIKEKCKS